MSDDDAELRPGQWVRNIFGQPGAARPSKRGVMRIDLRVNLYDRMGRAVYENDWVLCYDGRVGRAVVVLDGLSDPYVFVDIPGVQNLVGYRPSEIQAISPLEALASVG